MGLSLGRMLSGRSSVFCIQVNTVVQYISKQVP